MAQTTVSVLSSDMEKLVIQIICEPNNPDDLAPIELLIGLPDSNLPSIITRSEKPIAHPFQVVIPTKTQWIHQQKLNDLQTGTIQVSPLSSVGLYYPSQTITIYLNGRNDSPPKLTSVHQNLLPPKVLNWNTAKNWIHPPKHVLHKIRAMPKGRWIQFNIEHDGIYKIPANAIHSALDTGESLDPRNFMLFTASAMGRDRTYNLTQKITNNATIPENLIELAIMINGESDGSLDTSDEIYFYGQGPSGFDQNADQVRWHQNLYFIQSVYWLLIPDDNSIRGKRIETGKTVEDGPLSIDYGFVHSHFESDLINPHKSGLAWGNTVIKQGSSFSQEVDLGQPVSSISASGTFGMIGKESVKTRYENTKHAVQLSLNSQELSLITWSNIGLKSGGFSIAAGTLPQGSQAFQISNISDNPNSEPLFDFLTLSYAQKLIYSYPFEFFAPVTANDMTFTISGADIQIWNITDLRLPQNVPNQTQNDLTLMRVSLPPDTLQRYFVFNHDDIPSIENLSLIGIKNFYKLKDQLSGADHVIIGPETFRTPAQTLISHRGKSFYASIGDIYDEFSGGNQDPVAIRHFLQWARDNWTTKPYTVLLLGDGDYDYRNITGQSNIIIPPLKLGRFILMPPMIV